VSLKQAETLGTIPTVHRVFEFFKQETNASYMDKHLTCLSLAGNQSSKPVAELPLLSTVCVLFEGRFEPF